MQAQPREQLWGSQVQAGAVYIYADTAYRFSKAHVHLCVVRHGQVRNSNLTLLHMTFESPRAPSLVQVGMMQSY